MVIFKGYVPVQPNEPFVFESRWKDRDQDNRLSQCTSSPAMMMAINMGRGLYSPIGGPSSRARSSSEERSSIEDADS